MRDSSSLGRRVIACLSAWLAFWPAAVAPAVQPGDGLRIIILEGDEAILNVRQRVAREAVIQVEDENRRPVAGALLTLTAPREGASVVFANGLNNITVVTDELGRATVRGIRPNSVGGRFSIRVTAVKDGLKGAAEIHMTNAAPAAAAGGLSAKLIAILAAAGAAGTGVAIAATRNGSASPAAPPPTSITPGTVTVGPPR